MLSHDDGTHVSSRHAEIGLSDLRREALLLFLGAAFAFASYYLAFVSDSLQWKTWLTPALLLMLVILAFQLRDHLHLAGSVLVLGMLLLVVLEGVLRRDPAVYYFFSPVVGVTSVVLGTRAGIVAAAAATAAIALGPTEDQAALSSGEATAQVFLSWSSVFLSWALYRSLHTALDWSWNSFVQAQAKTEELQVHQAELKRTLNSLNEAYDRLERLNDELAYARRAAEEARRLKAEFAANVSHELRTPLNLVIGFAETMVMAPESYGGQPLPAPYRSDLDAIYRNACHLSSLIDDILDLSQIEAGRMGLVKESADLAPIVDEAWQVVAGLYEAKRLQFIAELPSDLPKVFVDRTRIRQVLINLLSNAARFTDEGGVTVSARVEATALVVQVADTGVGILPRDLPHVFEEFYQPVGTLQKHDGSGLGLTICKRFVEAHGGSIWAESQPGHGSAFSFSLPLIDNVVTALPPGEWLVWDRTQRNTAPKHTLVAVCEDGRVVRMLRRYMDGYEVLATSSLAEARELARDELVRGIVVVSDSPAGALARLTELDGDASSIPVAVCSLPSRAELQRELGVAAYLMKPVSRAELLKTIADLGRPVTSALVVDDDPEVVQMLARMLRSAVQRLRVRFAFGGAEAKEILAEWQPDVVLLDLLMPEVDGYSVADWMKGQERLRDIPIVVITARGAQEEMVRAGFFGVSRPGGLPIGQITRHLKLGFE